ncbi:hypothetical protein Dda_2923 [Drechslerella dactyloides]|uniref:Uncharacterized protein n=1 Tax=Drechslerella dactyloides TaxID=74499 RepID=A0AAD6NMD2_DREDA|nr:hypothetical protein Dda_2923 [Drechslerella dactyloides]
MCARPHASSLHYTHSPTADAQTECGGLVTMIECRWLCSKRIRRSNIAVIASLQAQVRNLRPSAV